ncbi:MAG: diaminopimelate decarboxylase family protein [Thermoanaerobaculia bacterium]
MRKRRWRGRFGERDSGKIVARGVPPRVLRRMKDGSSDGLLRRAALHFGTPFYLYDFDVIERRVRDLRRALGPRFEIAFAVKANPSLGILSFLSRLGLSSDVASRGELLAVRRAGCPPSKILSTGPAKSDADLEALVRARVSQIHVEGEWEMEALESIAGKLGRRVRIGLRLNPPWGIAEKRVIIGGPGAKKFGFDLRSAEKVLRMKRDRGAFAHLELCGFQVFNASNVLDARLLLENTERVLSLALSFSKKFSVPLRSVDFGGGFGVPYADGERPLDLKILQKGFGAITRRVGDEPLLRGTRLVFEPGRFLVAESGTYVVRVLGTKRSRGVEYVLVDGGIHHFLRPVLFGTPHGVRLLPEGGGRRPQPSSPSKKSLVISGPLCTSLDVLHASARLPSPRRGDLVAFENAGAYGYSESMPLFLSHEWPAEVGLRKGRLALLRRPPSVKALLAAQRPTPPRL